MAVNRTWLEILAEDLVLCPPCDGVTSPVTPGTVASPLCFFDPPCPKKGRAVLGDLEAVDGAINQTIRCVTCGRSGVSSRSTDPRRPGDFLKLDQMGTP
jgi:hypothetical protein